MEVKTKVCRWCTKTFKPNVKQQRYCSHFCAFNAKKKVDYRKYLEGKTQEATQPTFSTMYGLDWARDNDLSGIHLGKERYHE